MNEIDVVLEAHLQFIFEFIFIFEDDRHPIPFDRVHSSLHCLQITALNVNLHETDGPLDIQRVDCERLDRSTGTAVVGDSVRPVGLKPFEILNGKMERFADAVVHGAKYGNDGAGSFVGLDILREDVKHEVVRFQRVDPSRVAGHLREQKTHLTEVRTRVDHDGPGLDVLASEVDDFFLEDVAGLDHVRDEVALGIGRKKELARTRLVERQ